MTQMFDGDDRRDLDPSVAMLVRFGLWSFLVGSLTQWQLRRLHG
jgi:hypothetical protein